MAIGFSIGWAIHRPTPLRVCYRASVVILLLSMLYHGPEAQEEKKEKEGIRRRCENIALLYHQQTDLFARTVAFREAPGGEVQTTGLRKRPDD